MDYSAELDYQRDIASKLDRIRKGAPLPTAEENREWARRCLEKLCADYSLSWDDAIEIAKQHAPTLLRMLEA